MYAFIPHRLCRSVAMYKQTVSDLPCRHRDVPSQGTHCRHVVQGPARPNLIILSCAVFRIIFYAIMFEQFFAAPRKFDTATTEHGLVIS